MRRRFSVSSSSSSSSAARRDATSASCVSMCGNASCTMSRARLGVGGLAAVPALAQSRPRRFRLGPGAQLAQREAEQLLDVEQLLEPLLVVLVVHAVAAARSPALGQQAELLVVAHRARRRARAAGELSDPELLLDGAHGWLSVMNMTYTSVYHAWVGRIEPGGT